MNTERRQTPVTNMQARAMGLKRFYTGKPCKNGHVAELRASNGECFTCARERTAKWSAANPARKKETDRLSYAANPEPTRERSRQRYAANRDDALARRRQWDKDNPIRARENGRLSVHHRRARQAGAPGIHTAAETRAIFAAQRGLCVYCSSDLATVKKHLDHRNPLARGGSNSAENLQWLCAPCNLAKGAQDPALFKANLSARRMAA